MPETPIERDIELITKRLLISGLTPAISSDDLSRRIGTFGSVTALDGLGKLDALDQPRNFAHVTLETTKTQLSRCMNVLSGSTWKGAKLRIGEAKPDFRERILIENASSDEQPPRKRQRLARGVQGKHAQDMSLVTSENVHLRPQWRVTPLGRLIRPMRMRPARPLGPPLHALSKTAQQSSSLTHNQRSQKKGKAKKKRAPPTRARRQTIDPLRWGSTHLSGVFLDGGSALPSTSALVAGGAGPATGTNGECMEVEADEEVEEILDATQSPVDDHDDREMIPHSAQAPPRLPSSIVVESTSADFAAEKTRTLQLLHSMFGDANEDWGCAEIIDSDMEQAAAESGENVVPNASQDAIADFEVVPAAQRRADNKSSADRPTTALRNHEPAPAPTQPSSTTTLKDLFAPRENEGFSLIGHLDLDLDSELDLDLDEPALTNNAPPPMTTTPTSISISISTSAPRSAIAPGPARITQQAKGHLDATLPFFFPHGSHALAKGQHLVRGAVMFGRTEDEAQIRARWEAGRGELTREWKRRHREAVKSRRRRGGGGTAGGERAD